MAPTLPYVSFTLSRGIPRYVPRYLNEYRGIPRYKFFRGTHHYCLVILQVSAALSLMATALSINALLTKRLATSMRPIHDATQLLIIKRSSITVTDDKVVIEVEI